VPRRVDKEKKTAEIGAAAVRVFRDMGYHNTRMADIADAASVGKGTLYEYFKNKQDILQFEFEQYFAAFTSGAVKAMAQASSPGARLLSLVNFAFAHLSEWQNHCAVYVDYFGSARSNEAGNFSLKKIYDEIQSIIERLIQEGQASGEINKAVDPSAAAELLVSVFDGIILHGVFTERGCEMDALRTAAQEMIISGLFAAGPENTKTKD
jgi:AcrR family transcriptional regulator